MKDICSGLLKGGHWGILRATLAPEILFNKLNGRDDIEIIYWAARTSFCTFPQVVMTSLFGFVVMSCFSFGAYYMIKF